MEGLRSKLKTNIMLCRLLIVVLIIIFIVLKILEYRKVLHGDTNIGFFSTGIIVLVMNILRMKKALRDEKSLKELYIRNTDERVISIQLRAANSTSLLTIFLLCIGMMVSSYINDTVAYTLAVALGIYILIYLSSLVYFNKKM
ncbi:MAG: hypothetical protein J6U00_10170 [Ruminococcus sp.]|uniref:hypothetical protein n=1 Tax=Ruminococcus sp. TaxID=41978 RepID=UPI001B11B4CA|nr:hypothetical protein [Ruminococcus sp.]MBO7474342.1 hypothetical protein [Ruminococcus sp.]